MDKIPIISSEISYIRKLQHVSMFEYESNNANIKNHISNVEKHIYTRELIGIIMGLFIINSMRPDLLYYFFAITVFNLVTVDIVKKWIPISDIVPKMVKQFLIVVTVWVVLEETVFLGLELLLLKYFPDNYIIWRNIIFALAHISNYIYVKPMKTKVVYCIRSVIFTFGLGTLITMTDNMILRLVIHITINTITLICV